MADLVCTAANVRIASASTQYERVRVGEAMTQPQPAYLHTDGRYYKADANDGVAKANVSRLIITPAPNAGDYAIAVIEGDVVLGATLAQGTIYALSDDMGICPSTDVASTHFVTSLGVARSTSVLAFKPTPSGVQKP